jgi:endonuclease YncB( thermonuclease family)
MIAVALLLALPSLPACTVTDGDTIRCADERIRLTGINAPEMRGHCRRGMDCPPGDPIASRQSLQAVIAGKRLTIRRLGRDRYGRTLAVVYADGVNIACHQLRTGNAEYRERWDNKRVIGRECR